MMKKIAIGLAVCLACLGGAGTAFAGTGMPAPTPAKFHVFTSEDDGFFDNSVIVEGRDQLLLIDAQLTRSNALKVLALIRTLDKDLKQVYITHEHADHFLGLEVFKDAFPKVDIIANSAVAERIDAVYAEKLRKWQGLLGPAAASRQVAITRFDGDRLAFGDTAIELRTHLQGDTSENTYLWFPRERVAVVSDMAYDQMHVYTVETTRQSRARWIGHLDELAELKPAMVIPGHSRPRLGFDADSAIRYTRDYLTVFEEELSRSRSGADLQARMQRRYPQAGLFFSVERTAAALFKD